MSSLCIAPSLPQAHSMGFSTFSATNLSVRSPACASREMLGPLAPRYRPRIAFRDRPMSQPARAASRVACRFTSRWAVHAHLHCCCCVCSSVYCEGSSNPYWDELGQSESTLVLSFAGPVSPGLSPTETGLGVLGAWASEERSGMGWVCALNALGSRVRGPPLCALRGSTACLSTRLAPY